MIGRLSRNTARGTRLRQPADNMILQPRALPTLGNAG